MRLAPTYPVTTNRLSLRPLAASDSDALLSYRSREDVCRYVPFEPMTAAVIAERLAGQWSQQTLEAEGDAIVLGVTLTETRQLVGDVMLRWSSAEHSSGEIGYVFSPEAAGNGYATEAMHAILHLGFDDLGLHRLIARIDGRNDASTRVCDRLLMRREAHLISNEWIKGEWTDEVDYGLVQSEWVAGAGRNDHCRRC